MIFYIYTYIYICFNIFQSSKFKIQSSKFEVESHSMLGPFRSSVVRSWVARSWVVRSWVLFEVESFSKLSLSQLGRSKLSLSKVGRLKLGLSKFSRWIKFLTSRNLPQASCLKVNVLVCLGIRDYFVTVNGCSETCSWIGQFKKKTIIGKKIMFVVYLFTQ